MKRRNFAKKHQFRRYEAKRMKNPYFRPQRKRVKISWKFLLVFFGFILVFCIIFFSPLFRIDQVNISGAEHFSADNIKQIAEQELNKPRFLFLPGNNWLILKEERINNALYENFVFESVLIERNGNSLQISVKERVSTLIWRTDNRHYFVDLTGTILREIPDVNEETVFDYPIFSDQNNVTVSIGQKVLSESHIQGAINFLMHTEEQGIVINYFQRESQEDDWLSARSSVGYWILFNPEEGISEQVDNLTAVLRDSIEALNLIQYIDLRFGDHVYYK